MTVIVVMNDTETIHSVAPDELLDSLGPLTC